jgi:hypothetical protein
MVKRNKISMLLSSLTGKKEEEDKLFDNIYGYDNIKRFLRLS